MSTAAVIGLGSPIMGDDGFGIVALARLRAEWLLDDVELVDGGTWGMSLLPSVEDAEQLVLLDAIAAGRQPGDVVILEREQLPIYLTRKLSPHQVDMRDVLALAELRGTLPLETVAIGAEPGPVELGVNLSTALTRALDPVIDAVIARLRQWGHRCERLEAVACTR